MKIVLVCSAGMSTSMLVKRMQEAASEEQFEVEIVAVAEAEVSKIQGIDILMLGPQVRYLKSKFNALEATGIPVTVIDTVKYGTMNGKAVLNDAKALLKI